MLFQDYGSTSRRFPKFIYLLSSSRRILEHVLCQWEIEHVYDDRRFDRHCLLDCTLYHQPRFRPHAVSQQRGELFFSISAFSGWNHGEASGLKSAVGHQQVDFPCFIGPVEFSRQVSVAAFDTVVADSPRMKLILKELETLRSRLLSCQSLKATSGDQLVLRPGAFANTAFAVKDIPRAVCAAMLDTPSLTTLILRQSS